MFIVFHNDERIVEINNTIDPGLAKDMAIAAGGVYAKTTLRPVSVHSDTKELVRIVPIQTTRLEITDHEQITAMRYEKEEREARRPSKPRVPGE